MLSMIKPWKLLFALTLLASAGAAVPGCGGPSGASICDAKCQCEGCSTVDYNNCRAQADSNETLTAQLGCGPYLDDLLACQDSTGVCVAGHDWQTSCGVQKDRWENCVDPKKK